MHPSFKEHPPCSFSSARQARTMVEVDTSQGRLGWMSHISIGWARCGKKQAQETPEEKSASIRLEKHKAFPEFPVMFPDLGLPTLLLHNDSSNKLPEIKSRAGFTPTLASPLHHQANAWPQQGMDAWMHGLDTSNDSNGPYALRAAHVWHPQ